MSNKVTVERVDAQQPRLKAWVLVDKHGNLQTWQAASYSGPDSESQLEAFNKMSPDAAPFRSVMMSSDRSSQEPSDALVLAACRELNSVLFSRGLKPLAGDGPRWREQMAIVETNVRKVLTIAAQGYTE